MRQTRLWLKVFAGVSHNVPEYLEARHLRDLDQMGDTLELRSWGIIRRHVRLIL